MGRAVATSSTLSGVMLAVLALLGFTQASDTRAIVRQAPRLPLQAVEIKPTPPRASPRSTSIPPTP